ncbi:hypothetical protein Bcav_0359 [Beutenbergia cavernae DSM 12333]|uniref:Uncharacterized protein n=1 Tax=Beutenbergia cavernae (strain ATCC BAA-8 / DSM 12333 / CCUG 43141 / JCM 11478 / NBRC 16432 / NCIMB 13614 / HKI 0122) TaxID=471853 RepID=C5BWG5_BEUC1|nr:hypothetical protein [Beutenbergia cavernae]ACQ78623.1 hypothetical protein Bcav_0359 [Beutenbergia cavernae DSM 12333]
MTASGAVEEYLAQVSAQLPRGRRARDVCDELRDGLTEAIEICPSLVPQDAAALLVREFGTPQEVGSALAAEIRLRLARRNSAYVLGVLLASWAGWLVFDSTVGVPETSVPTGWAGAVFLAGIDVLRAAAIVAQVGAALGIVATSFPMRRLAPTTVPTWLTRLTLTALSIFGLAVLVALASMAPGHHLLGALVAVPVCAMTVTAVALSRRAARHLAVGANGFVADGHARTA